MKKFDLELALKGEKVQTIGGNAVRVVCADAKNKDYPLVVLYTGKEGNEFPLMYTIDGKLRADLKDSHPDTLVMADEEKEYKPINFETDVESVELPYYDTCVLRIHRGCMEIEGKVYEAKLIVEYHLDVKRYTKETLLFDSEGCLHNKIDIPTEVSYLDMEKCKNIIACFLATLKNENRP